MNQEKVERVGIKPPLTRHCEAHRAEATQGNINSGPRQSTRLLRFARNDAGMGRWLNTPSPNPLPQEGEGLIGSSPLPEGEGGVRALLVFLK